jgi:colicin import membrane protein
MIMLSSEWKLPLNLAIGMHILVLLGGLYLPGLFKAKPKFADIYTVSIINIAEPGQQAASSEGPPPSVTPQTVKPLKNKKLAPIAETVAAPTKAVKSISLKPLKRKKKKKITPVKKNNEAVKKKRQKLADAIKQEELLAERARLAQEALENERQLLTPVKSQTKTAPASSTSSKSQGNAGGGSGNLIESKYFASITNKLLQHWALPESLEQNPDLRAIVVVTINKDGTIADRFFENKSGNRLFDQFVIRTIEAAAPLPPIPVAMKKRRFEVGLVFSPGGIQ